MRRVIIALFLSFLFIGIGLYISSNTSPFNLDIVKQVAQTDNLLTDQAFNLKFGDYLSNGFIWDMLDIRQFNSWVVVWSLGAISLFSFFHLLIDKLFFRKFYEEPSIFDAVRRGLLIVIIFIGAIYLRLIDGLVWYNVASIALLSICLEIFYLNLRRKKSS
jgi:hypothetical protein